MCKAGGSNHAAGGGVRRTRTLAVRRLQPGAGFLAPLALVRVTCRAALLAQALNLSKFARVRYEAEK